MRMTISLAKSLLAAALLAGAGCTTLPSGEEWGEAATPTPGWDRVKDAAKNAAVDPWVWGPLVGAVAFQIDDWDERTADWAQETTPVFGSQRSAEQWSDDLRDASSIAHYATVLAVPSGGEPTEWLWNKTKGTLVHVAAVSTTTQLTNGLKDLSDRERPNGLARASFPSGHTSASAVHTRLASRTLMSMQISRRMRRSLDAGLLALTIGTSWARVEAGWHYPADTLAGMALGNFVASFFNDAFLGLHSTGEARLSIDAIPHGAMLTWSIAIR
jgi:hypothetical protein